MFRIDTSVQLCGWRSGFQLSEGAGKVDLQIDEWGYHHRRSCLLALPLSHFMIAEVSSVEMTS